jgi:hypothetical protein
MAGSSGPRARGGLAWLLVKNVRTCPPAREGRGVHAEAHLDGGLLDRDAGERVRCPLRHDGVADGRPPSMPAMATFSPASAPSTRFRARPSKTKSFLGDLRPLPPSPMTVSTSPSRRVPFTMRPMASGPRSRRASRLHTMIWSGAFGSPAGGGTLLDDGLEERHEVGVLSRGCLGEPLTADGVEHREVGLRVAGLEVAEEVEHLVEHLARGARLGGRSC